MTLFTDKTGVGKPLVLLHGWGLNHHVWSGVTPQLSQHSTVVTIDLPGHGRSTMPVDAYSLQSVTEMIVHEIETTYTGQPVIILGWSLGGLLAMNITIHHPGLLSGLILVSSTPRFVRHPTNWPDAMAIDVLAGFANELQLDYQTTVQRFLALQSMGSLRAKEEIQFLRNALLDEEFSPKAEALIGGLRLLQEVDLRDEVAHIKCPCLIISGDRDRLVNPAIGTALSKLIPQSTHVVIKGAGHAPFISHQDSFIALVERFCDKNG